VRLVEEKLQVKKRDGTIESWNYDKILNSVMKAGLPLEKSQSLVTEIENWAKSSSKDKIISSIDIRDKIIEVMKRIEPMTASVYEAYRK
jgi:transcriptional regulator NrdR family protein